MRQSIRQKLAAIASGLLLMGCADAQSAMPKLPPDLETELALSAAPSHLRGQASVYLYDPETGMHQSQAGSNGYTCFVARTDIEELENYPEYRDDLLIPICFDAEGSRSFVPAWFYAEEQRAKGMNAGDLAEALKSKVAAPKKPGVSTMISPFLRAYTPGGEVATLNVPHYMFYASNTVFEDLGGIQFSLTYPFPRNRGGADGKAAYMIQMLGAAETAAINAEYGEMLKRLCDTRADGAYCLDFDTINASLRAQLNAALKSLPAK